MSGEGRTILVFGALLVSHGLLLFVWSTDALSHLLIWLTTLVAFALVALLVSRPPPDAPRVVPDTSLATVGLALGLALVLGGVAFGWWLALIGAEVVALGVGGLLRERRASHRRVA